MNQVSKRRVLPSRFEPYKNIRIGKKFLEKQCSKCHKWRPLNLDFYDRDPTRFYGYKSQCKVCQGIYGMFHRRFEGVVQ